MSGLSAFQQLVLNSVVSGASHVLVAVGFSLIYRTIGFFHFAHGAVYTAGGYIAYAASVWAGVEPFGACVVGVIGGAVLGLLIERGVYRPLRGAPPLVLLLASIGVMLALQNLIALMFGDDPRVLGQTSFESIGIFSARTSVVRVWMVVTAVIVSAVTWLFWRHSALGRSARALAEDRELAIAHGVEEDRVVAAVMVLGSAIAAGAAVLHGLDVGLTPQMGFDALLFGVIAAIIGGIGSVAGAVLGGVFIGFAQHFGVWWFPSHWEHAIVFAVFVLFLLLRPQGFLGRPLRTTTV